MNNLYIRETIKTNRICHYEVASRIGVSESTLCRWLREELTGNKKIKVEQAIKDIISNRKVTE